MIIRTGRKLRFTIIDNRILEDDRLSLKAKGILCYLLSRPDNWQVSDAHLSTIGPDGEAAVRSALKEIEDAGYLVRVRQQGERGRFEWTSYVYDEPQGAVSPQDGFPPVDNPPMGNPPVERPPVDNRTLINTDGIKTKKQLLPTPPQADDGSSEEVPAVKKLGAVHKCWQQNMPGTLTPIIVGQINDLIDEYGPDSMLRAIEVAVNANVRTMRYIKGVLSKDGAKVQTNGNGKQVSVKRVEGEEW